MATTNNLELSIDVDASRGNTAIQKFNAGLNGMEVVAVNAARHAAEGFDWTTDAIVKSGHATKTLIETYGLLTAGTVAATVAQGGLGNALVNTYRAARLALSPTLFTGATLAIGILAEQAISAAQDLDRLAQKSAFLSGRNGQSVANNLQLAFTERARGLESGTLTGLGRTANDIATLAEEFSKLTDPAERARKAVAEFGVDAEKMLPLMTLRLRDNIDASAELAKELDGPMAASLRQFAEDLKVPGESLKGMYDYIVNVSDATSVWLAKLAAGTHQILQFKDSLDRGSKGTAEGFGVATPAGATPTYQQSIRLMGSGIQDALGRFNASVPGASQQQVDAAKAVAVAHGQTLEATNSALSASKSRLAKLTTQYQTDIASRSLISASLISAQAETADLAARVKLMEDQKKLAAKWISDAASAARILESASVSGATPFEKIGIELKYNLGLYGSTKKAIEDITKASEIMLEVQLKAMNLGVQNAAKGIANENLGFTGGVLKENADSFIATEAMRKKTIESAAQFELTQLGYVRDEEIRGLEKVNAQTLAQKIAAEQRKSEIEVDYLTKSFNLKLATMNRETEAEIGQMAVRAGAGLISEDTFWQRRKALMDATMGKQVELNAVTTAQIMASIENTAIRQNHIVLDQYKSIFSSLKQQAGGVFDALFDRSRSVWSAIANSFKTIILTALKDIVTSRVAVMLMNMFVPGSNAKLVQGGLATGGLAGLLGIGSQVAFGGGGPMGAIGSLGATPPFVGGGAAAGGSGGVGGMASYGAMFAGYKGLLSKIGNLGTGNAANSNVTGIGGNMGGAMLLGGGALAFDGLRRGGMFGLGETTAGGALIGAKFGGGPLGALIGGGIGALAGIVRLFVKGAEEKLKSKIKEVYGVDVQDKEFLQSIVDLAKQSFGGNLDLTIRSSQVRDWLMYYKMQTNQAAAGLGAIDNAARGVSLSGYGGAVSQNNVFVGGTGYNYGGSTASGSGGKTFEPQTPSVNLTLQIDGRDVNASVQRANTGSSGRRESAAILMDPLLTYG